MNNDPRDGSTEDEGVDEDMMFEFEEDLSARLSLHEDSDRAASRARDARSPVVTGPPPSALPQQPARPQNPVAAVLLSVEAEFASLSASPCVEYGSSPAQGYMGCFSAPPELHDKSPSFDDNGRRKRKFYDDSCCVTPRVRPLAKRAKSFSCVGDVLLPDCGFRSISSPSVAPSVVEQAQPGGSSASASSSSSLFSTGTASALFSSSSSSSSSSRSKSIQIPHRGSGAHARSASAAPHHHQQQQRSSSGPARGSAAYVSKTLDVPAASSDPLATTTTRPASSWNASVEYFCRRSLDISSPLRSRFRDLVVSSVGRAGSLKSP